MEHNGGTEDTFAPVCRRTAAAILLVVAAGRAMDADAQAGRRPGEAPPPIEQVLEDTGRGHGAMSIGYLNTLVNGFRASQSNILPNGSVRSHTIDLSIDYFVTNGWSLHAEIPYIVNRYQGSAPHCPTAAPPQCAKIPVLAHPHPESRFLDDGSFHGDWQDWVLGVSYLADIDGYFVTPSLTLYLPSHDYTYFANAAVGQDLTRVELGATLAHQFEFTELYYRVGLAHVFAEETLGQNIDYNKVDLETGYFLNEAWTIKLFGTAKKGDAKRPPPPPNFMTTELWYHHDQRAAHNYASLGFGADYHFKGKYTLSSSLQREIWGQAVFNFKYAFELRLAREF